MTAPTDPKARRRILKLTDGERENVFTSPNPPRRFPRKDATQLTATASQSIMQEPWQDTGGDVMRAPRRLGDVLIHTPPEWVGREVEMWIQLRRAGRRRREKR